MGGDAPWLPMATGAALAVVLVALVASSWEPLPHYWEYRGGRRLDIEARVHDRRVRVTDLSGGDRKPRVLEIEDLLSGEECDRIVALARDRGLVRSHMVFGSEEERAKARMDARTSTQVFLDQFEDVVLDRIARRIENLTLLPAENSEQMQVVHYDPGQHYWAHYDYLPQESVRSRWRAYREGKTADNRFATVLFYLNDVERGGETVFPRFTPHWSAERHGWDQRVCNESFPSLRVSPKKGNGILFYNMRGWKLDEYSLHGGCDPLSGEKWAANLWLHLYPFQQLQ